MFSSLDRAINNYSGEFSLQHGFSILVFQCSSKLLKVSKCDCLFTLDKATLWNHRSPCRDTYFPCTKATRRDTSQHLLLHSKITRLIMESEYHLTRPAAVYFLENKLIPNNRRPSKIGAYGTCIELELENRRTYR